MGQQMQILTPGTGLICSGTRKGHCDLKSEQMGISNRWNWIDWSRLHMVQKAVKDLWFFPYMLKKNYWKIFNLGNDLVCF